MARRRDGTGRYPGSGGWIPDLWSNSVGACLGRPRRITHGSSMPSSGSGRGLAEALSGGVAGDRAFEQVQAAQPRKAIDMTIHSRRDRLAILAREQVPRQVAQL